MMIEKSVDKTTNSLIEPKSFRTIHYLGSKLRVLEFIKEVIDDIDPERNGICDLFSGTGSVSNFFSNERKVVSVDIQSYSSIICSALLKPVSDEFTTSFQQVLTDSNFNSEYLKIFQPLIDFEDSIINEGSNINLELICHYLENASLYSYLIEENNEKLHPQLNEAFKAVKLNLESSEEKSFIATRYLGGVYFSYKQSVMLDAIISEIEKTDLKYHDTFFAALLSTASDIVNTVGKQFAQPIRPRNKQGEPKKGLTKQLQKDRNINVLNLYIGWLEKYLINSPKLRNHQILKMDFRQALQNLDDDVRVIYADPPYTRDHYSRFYHGLETLSLRDYPKISKTKIGGKEKLSRGLYRVKREQSEFCIRSKAPKAFHDLFKLASRNDRILIISYSPYDKTKGAHPRVVEIETLEEMAKSYFNSVEIRSIGKFTHSKLNRTDLHLKAEEAAEVLVICKNK